MALALIALTNGLSSIVSWEKREYFVRPPCGAVDLAAPPTWPSGLIAYMVYAVSRKY